MNSKKKATINNCKCKYTTVEEEQEDRNKTIEGQLEIYRELLPKILEDFEKIKDYRNPKKIKHKLTTILIFGLLIFVFQISSRREATREMSRPMFLENLKTLFPELETMPHNDTLNRVLMEIDVSELETIILDLVKNLIRNKKFKKYLNENAYQIAIDGTQKFKRYYKWEDECLERKNRNGDKYYYVYVLEANLVFSNGINLPLMSEFLNYEEFKDEKTKQDCELKAFYRLTARLKKYYPRLNIMLLLDGLYANGVVMNLCEEYKWQYMIVLQNKSLKSVWNAFNISKDLENNNEISQIYNDRTQDFTWVNNINYTYTSNGVIHEITTNVVVCEENWKEIDIKTNEIIEKKSTHAWLSSKNLTKENVSIRCNLCARYRWAIEISNLVEKHQGYYYEACLSYDWNAMKGYHYLMRLAHFMNELMVNSVNLLEKVKENGVRGLIKFVKETLSSPWLLQERISKFIKCRKQIRLI